MTKRSFLSLRSSQSNGGHFSVPGANAEIVSPGEIDKCLSVSIPDRL